MQNKFVFVTISNVFQDLIVVLLLRDTNIFVIQGKEHVYSVCQRIQHKSIFSEQCISQDFWN